MTTNLLFLNKHLLFFLLLLGAAFLHAQENLSINQIQVIGSHNSYKEAIEQPLMDFMLKSNPKVQELDYAHLPISEQLDMGLRGLELDVLYDPKGGRYTRPKGLELLGLQGKATQPYDTSNLIKPGFKVFHVPDIDFRSSCLTFKACLSTIKEWSEVHPNHLPIIITINPKTSGIDLPGFTEVLPFDEQVLNSLDQEIMQIIESEKLITPGLVRGKYPTLRAAILKQGWPNLEDARGKLLFVLDAGKTITQQYIGIGDFNRPMFVDVEKDHPQAGFFIKNNPIKQEKEIRALVEQGFMVRTRSDANTREARNGDQSRFEAAIRSGAQLISTDYYLKSLSPNQDFEIIFKEHAYSQCNPVLVKASACKL